ncbi:hypothetical protein PTKIN_Ptkin15bG0154300 [Pterospermum kingtungense]
MGNAGGREDGEGTSGAKNNGLEVENEQSNSDPMLIHSPPHSPNEAYQLPFLFPPQIRMFPWLRSAEMLQAQNDVLVQNTTPFEYLHSEHNLPWETTNPARHGQMMQVQNDALMVQNTTYHKEYVHQEEKEEKRAVMITWCFGGKQVAITGSWDNWRTIEPLHSLGKDFIIMKLLPLGVYHYHFIVDKLMRYDPNLPCEFDDSGNAYNILDLQEFVPEATESLSEFESPPSPISSYNNQPLTAGDFNKAPPELPPQLPKTLLDQQSLIGRSHKSSARPSHTLLNHLYKQDGYDGKSVALCTTHRFLSKYVTVVLYKPLHSSN